MSKVEQLQRKLDNAIARLYRIESEILGNTGENFYRLAKEREQAKEAISQALEALRQEEGYDEIQGIQNQKVAQAAAMQKAQSRVVNLESEIIELVDKAYVLSIARTNAIEEMNRVNHQAAAAGAVKLNRIPPGNPETYFRDAAGSARQRYERK